MPRVNSGLSRVCVRDCRRARADEHDQRDHRMFHGRGLYILHLVDMRARGSTLAAKLNDVNADGLGLVAPADLNGLALRHGGDRRHVRRRRTSRDFIDRRRGERRKARLRSLAFAALSMLFTPHYGRVLPKAKVSVSMDEFRAIPADKAYETLIQEAASTYHLDPSLIRAVMRIESA